MDKIVVPGSEQIKSIAIINEDEKTTPVQNLLLLLLL